MSSLDSTLYVVIPVYNELENLEQLFASLRLLQTALNTFQMHVVFADDGSTDGTPARARELADDLNLHVLTTATNQGPGAAFGRAFEYLAPRITSTDWVLTLEGDNTSRRELIPRMFKRADEGYDVVLASPYMYGGGITNTSPLRVFMSHMANAFVKEFLGAHGILTMSSFFRLYRASVLVKLQACYGARILERTGFECMIELLLKMMYLGITISEVPLVLDTSQRKGKSKMKIWKTVRGYMALSRQTGRWRRLAEAVPSSASAAHVTP